MGLPHCALLLLLQHQLRLSASIRWLLVGYIVLLRIACGTVLLSLGSIVLLCLGSTILLIMASTILLLIYGIVLGISGGQLRGLSRLGPIGAARQLLLLLLPGSFCIGMLLLLLPVLLWLLYLPGRCMGRTGRRPPLSPLLSL